MLLKTHVDAENGKFDALLLAPVSVLLEYRNQGIDSKLIRSSMDVATNMGFQAVFLAGDPAYYQRFGFIPIHKYSIAASVEVPPELLDHIMVRELVPGALDDVSGVVELE